MKTQRQLLHWLGQSGGDDRPLQHLVLDSRRVQADDVFVALPGQGGHGLDYLHQAIARGAALVLSDRPATAPVPLVVIPDLRARLGDLARWYYDAPDEALTLVGVTGTNGKSSTVWYLVQLWQALGRRAAMIGTLGYGEPDRLQPAANTTPDVLTLQRLLRSFVDAGIQAVAMEVSSHAIDQGRIDGLRFDAVVLTQMGRDHLDYHGSETAYHATKVRLFTDWPSGVQVLNAEDAQGRALAALCSNPVTFGRQQAAHLRCVRLVAHEKGLKGLLQGEDGSLACQTPLLGLFNWENICAALLACAKTGGPPLKILVEQLRHLKPVAGRMEKIADEPVVIVDYAHTPDGLAALLESVRAHYPGRTLWLVFGAGGERDRGKRPLMGQVAAQWADRIILTSDNPRCEDPQRILDDIAQGIAGKPLKIFRDRGRAIQTALQCARAQDVVVIAGKGHENTQQLCGQVRPFSDRDEVEKWLKR